MRTLSPPLFAALLAVAVFFAAGCRPAAADEPVRFAQQIRPLLTERCYRCHGPDQKTREGGLRLDERAGAAAELDSGARAIVPGKPDDSELLARVTAEDADLRMPPAEAGAPLKPAEVALVRRWIEQGAEFQSHWAFTALRRPAMHSLPDDDWSRRPLDRFVLRRLRDQKWTPAAEAPRAVLLRRVTLALTGLPPSQQQIQDFVAADSPRAYERAVDRLLASPAFGERWAWVWLDLARYADSAGYAQDPPRTIWRYRDWVIDALNRNRPFDQFTIEQLAGDMLPEATEAQRIATAFHRNTMTNSEGGTDDEEFRNAAVVDRVNTTMQVWMGLTMGCAQCHSHKYDPITQSEYFQMLAVFNNSADADRGNEAPLLTSFTPQMQVRRNRLQQQLDELRLKNQPKAVPLPSGPLKTKFVRVELTGKKVFLSLAEVQALVGQRNAAQQGKATQVNTDFGGDAKLAIDGDTNGHYFEAKSTTHTSASDNPWWEVELAKEETLEQVAVWNRTDGAVGSRLNNFRVIGLDAQRRPLWIKTANKPPSPSIQFKLPADAKQLSDEDRKQLARYQGGGEDPRITKLKQQLAAVKGVTTPVMEELQSGSRRKTHIQIRGNFLDKGEEVRAGVPAAFHPLQEGVEPNRLSIARWLTAKQNPLTARVTVNRFWEHLFGIGLVETSEDFGLQGEPPSHPELLDYLAAEFVEGGWDVKRLLREIVTSATYRQSTVVAPNVEAADPRNRLLSRGPRSRMPAEMIRDNALGVSGLLCRTMKGPSVRPPRPKLGLRAAFGGSTDWEPSPGGDRYRRGLYTSWRRTTPYPSMTTFDAPSREVCTVRRLATNTPLQALVLLNDPVYFEAAQALGRRAVRQYDNDDERIQWIFRQVIARDAEPREHQLVKELLDKFRAKYRAEKDPTQATQLATVPIGPLPEGMDLVEAASWTMLGNVMLNLDEFISPR